MMDKLNIVIMPLLASTLLPWTIIAGLALLPAVVALRRLYFSPISHIPGPKLAAMTQLYEMYYDVYLDGKFVPHFEALHKKYGPIVRVTPWEVHINDPDFYETIYTSNVGYDKVHEFISMTHNPRAAQATVSHALHKIRRAALDLHLTKRKIGFFAPEIHDRATKLCNILLQEYKSTGKVLNLGRALGCFSTDVVTEYAFAREYNYLDYPDFIAPFIEMAHEFLKNFQVLRCFPILRIILFSLPDRAVLFLKPAIGNLFVFKSDIAAQINDIMSGQNSKHKDASHPTVFNELLNSDLPPSQKTCIRLSDEGSTVIIAAIETTRWTMCVIFFHVLSNPEILRALKQEIFDVWPNLDTVPTLSDLEKLPYLTAVIQEGLRMGNGVTMRLCRRSDQPLPYGSYTIPSATSFSMAAYYVHTNPEIFPSPFTFNPSRWLADPTTGAMPRAPDGKLLTRYMVAFSRGTRSCTGINLGKAELYILIAHMIRKVELELFETTVEDVSFHSDHFLPAPYAGSKGVRALVM